MEGRRDVVQMQLGVGTDYSSTELHSLSTCPLTNNHVFFFHTISHIKCQTSADAASPISPGSTDLRLEKIALGGVTSIQPCAGSPKKWIRKVTIPTILGFPLRADRHSSRNDPEGGTEQSAPIAQNFRVTKQTSAPPPPC
jgi:hypothetical protein